jgi:ABC-type multidrug transport system fused ATPase/permease subunit
LDWKVIESGSHHELIKLDGKYKRMLDLQSGF